MRRTHFLLATFVMTAATGSLFAVACSSSSSSSSGAVVDSGGNEVESPDATPPNLAVNGSFEQSQAACAPPWTALPGSTLTTANMGHVGGHACEICNLDPNAKEVAVVVSVPIDPPTDGTVGYALTAFLRDLDGGAGAGNKGRLTLVPQDGSGQPIAASQGQVDVPIDSSSWRSFATSSTPPKSATQLEARVGGVIGPSGCMLVDDVVLYRAAP